MLRSHEPCVDYSNGFFSRYMQHIIKSYIPAKTKRLIYLSSLIAVLQKINNPGQLNSLQKTLSDIFKIGRHPNAIIFPMYIKSFIWTDICIETKLDISECSIPSRRQKIIDTIITNSPKWLMYDNQAIVRKDVELMIDSMPNLVVA